MCPPSRPWAVCKDADNSLEGCHATEQAAQDQLAALYASEADQELQDLAEEVVMAATETLGGKPSKGTPKDGRLHENNGSVKKRKKVVTTYHDLTDHQHDAPAAPPSEDATMTGPFRSWSGLLTVEGIETGDGREFAPDSLEWSDFPLPLQWQRESNERHLQSVVVGRIDGIDRADNGQIRGHGVLDLGSEVGREVERQMEGQLAGGVSVDVDSVKDSDVELVFPQAEELGDDDEAAGLEALFGPPPEKVIFHRGRIRGATLVALPAFVEARIELDPVDTEGSPPPSVVAAAIASHSTATSTGPWDGPANEGRLATPMPVATARHFYAWMANGAVQDGMCRKVDLKFGHHEVGSNGQPGAANLTACSAGIGALNGARGGTTIPSADRQGVYNHLAKHLRDAGREPPPLMHVDVLTAAAAAALRPPAEWFANPQLAGPTPWTIDDQGRVFGHLALWGTCHTSFADRCMMPPRELEYAYFHLGELETSEGGFVPVGHVTFGTGHAAARYDAAPAAQHYDHTGHVAADICCGADPHGIWVAGALRTGIADADLRTLRSACLSGDWRRIGGALRLIAVLAVNVPGFPVPRTHLRFSNDNLMSMTAAGVVTEQRVQSRADDDHSGTIRIRRRVVQNAVR